jgi:hypothetical protein
MDPRTEKMLADRQEREASAKPAKRGPTPGRGRGVAAGLAGAAVLVAVLGSYHVLVTRPAQAREEAEVATRAAERLKAEAGARQVETDNCLATAEAESVARWNAVCKQNRRQNDCTLSGDLTDQLEQQASQARNACLLTRSKSGH